MGSDGVSVTSPQDHYRKALVDIKAFLCESIWEG